MDDKDYAVILHYDSDLKEVHEKVVACLSRLDPTAPERIEKMASAGQLIVKRRTDRATANRLKELLSQTGARCSVRKHPSPPQVNIGAQSELAAKPASSAQGLDALLIKCPRCGYRQPPIAECRTCGVIIAKAKALKTPPGIESSPRRERSAPRWTQQRLMDLVHRHAGPIGFLIKKIQNPTGVRNLTSWAQRLSDKFIRCSILFAVALVLQTGLLALGKMLWYLYISTSAGQYYVQKLPDRAEVFQRIAHADIWSLGWESTLTVAVFCLLLGAAAQVLHLIRYLYESQGLLGKLILWIAPSAGAIGWFLSQRPPFPEYAIAVSLAMVPTVCLLSSCLYLARTALPEIGEFRKIFAIIAANRDKTWGAVAKKIRIWLDATK